MKQHYFKVIIITISILLLLTSCGRTSYQYNNLTSGEDIKEFIDIMVSAEVPDKDIEAVLEYIETYSDSEYSENAIINGWQQTTKDYQELYDYTDAINAYTSKEFEDINCRQAAFIIYHSFFCASEPENQNLQRESLELPEFLNEELYNYEILFSRIPMGETVADTVLNFWRDNGAVFEKASVHLVSIWGNSDGEVLNYHAGIMIEEEAGIVFFEKTDPIMPFQLSRFASLDELKAHLLSRDGIDGTPTIFLDDTLI